MDIKCIIPFLTLKNLVLKSLDLRSAQWQKEVWVEGAIKKLNRVQSKIKNNDGSRKRFCNQVKDR